MEKKNPWRMLFGLSVLASISSALFQSNWKKKGSDKTNVSTSLTPYVGTWKNNNRSLKVEITDDLDILINNQALDATLEEVKPDELVFRDHFGYYIILKKQSYPSLYIYDEAEEKEYHLNRVQPK